MAGRRTGRFTVAIALATTLLALALAPSTLGAGNRLRPDSDFQDVDARVDFQSTKSGKAIKGFYFDAFSCAGQTTSFLNKIKIRQRGRKKGRFKRTGPARGMDGRTKLGRVAISGRVVSRTRVKGRLRYRLGRCKVRTKFDATYVVASQG